MQGEDLADGKAIGRAKGYKLIAQRASPNSYFEARACDFRVLNSVKSRHLIVNYLLI